MSGQKKLFPKYCLLFFYSWKLSKFAICELQRDRRGDTNKTRFLVFEQKPNTTNFRTSNSNFWFVQTQFAQTFQKNLLRVDTT